MGIGLHFMPDAEGLAMPAENLADVILDAAQNPVRASGDGGSVEMRSLQDLIVADKHLKSATGNEKPARGMRITKLVPPGAP